MDVDALHETLRICQAISFLPGVEGFVWEALFHHLSGLKLPDSTQNERHKRLFDAVDSSSKIGWSLKTVQLRELKGGLTCAFVIKRVSLPSELKENLGAAILADWQGKIRIDQERQGVEHPKLGILLKNKQQTHFAYLEQELQVHEVTWTEQENGVFRGCLADGTVKYRWCPSGSQLFELIQIPKDIRILEIERKQLSVSEVLAGLRARM